MARPVWWNPSDSKLATLPPTKQSTFCRVNNRHIYNCHPKKIFLTLMDWQIDKFILFCCQTHCGFKQNFEYEIPKKKKYTQTLFKLKLLKFLTNVGLRQFVLLVWLRLRNHWTFSISNSLNFRFPLRVLSNRIWTNQ